MKYDFSSVKAVGRRDRRAQSECEVSVVRVASNPRSDDRGHVYGVEDLPELLPEDHPL